MSEFSGELTVFSWNVLLYHLPTNEVKPQAERILACARSLLSLGKQMDIVALYEAEISDTHGNMGEKIAVLTGNESGFWEQHSRPNEQIGMFGKSVDSVEFVKLDDDKTAVISKVGPISIAGVHLTFDLRGSDRRSKQVQVVLDKLAHTDKAIIMGDFNSLPWQKPRKLIEANGFQSAFTTLGLKRPATVPTKEFRPLLKKWERLTIGKGLAVDDIYCKGLHVKDAGTFEGPSDHRGLWATFKDI